MRILFWGKWKMTTKDELLSFTEKLMPQRQLVERLGMQNTNNISTKERIDMEISYKLNRDILYKYEAEYYRLLLILTI